MADPTGDKPSDNHQKYGSVGQLSFQGASRGRPFLDGAFVKRDYSGQLQLPNENF